MALNIGDKAPEVLGVNEGFNSMKLKLCKNEHASELHRFKAVSISCVIMIDFITKCATLKNSVYNIMKADCSNWFMRIVF